MDGMLDIYLNDNHTICFDYLNYSIQSLKMALKEQEGKCLLLTLIGYTSNYP
jgi:hypothetical protein